MTPHLIFPTVLLCMAAPDDGAVDLVSSSYCVCVVGDAPLPYQAVRLRQTFTNSDSRPFLNARCGVFFVAVKHPNADRYEAMSRAVWLRMPGPDLSSGRRQRTWGPRETVQLGPHEALSETQASAAFYKDNERVPLFPIAGDYRISWMGVNDYGRYVLVKVREPDGTDRAIHHQLQEDRLLAAAMMHPADVPDSQTVAQLETIVRQYPDSSYCDYALLALARSKLRGCGVEAMEEAVFSTIENAVQVLEDRLLDVRVTRSHLENDIKNRLKRVHDPLRGAETQMLNELSAACHGTEDDCRKAARRWAHFFYVSPEDRAAAMAYLKRIKRPGFAFRPLAMVMESRLLRIDRVVDEKVTHTGPGWSINKHWEYFYDLEHPYVKPMSDQLTRDYPDSIEWIWEMYRFIDTAEAWHAFRVQPAQAADRR